MHERGVCGCPVIFPDLIQPRVIAPSRPFQARQPSTQSTTTANSSVGKGRSKNNGKAKMAPAKKAVANTVGGPKKKKSSNGLQSAPQIEIQNNMTESSAGRNRLVAHQLGGNQQSASEKKATASKKAGKTQHGERHSSSSSEAKLGESRKDATSGQSMPSVVQAQIHSLYGAEWIHEHRQLHHAGSCKCAADFSYYQTPGVYGIIEPSPQVFDGQEQAVPVAGYHDAHQQTFENLSGALEPPNSSAALEYTMLCDPHSSGPSGLHEEKFHTGEYQGVTLESNLGQGFQDGGDGFWEQNINYPSHQLQGTCTASSQDSGPGYQLQDSQLYQPYEPWSPTANIHQGAEPGAWSTAQQVCLSSSCSIFA